MDNQAVKYKEVEVFHMKLELGKIFIKDIRFKYEGAKKKRAVPQKTKT